jgi:hypothetical protein
MHLGCNPAEFHPAASGKCRKCSCWGSVGYFAHTRNAGGAERAAGQSRRTSGQQLPPAFTRDEGRVFSRPGFHCGAMHSGGELWLASVFAQRFRLILIVYSVVPCSPHGWSGVIDVSPARIFSRVMERALPDHVPLIWNNEGRR